MSDDQSPSTPLDEQRQDKPQGTPVGPSKDQDPDAGHLRVACPRCGQEISRFCMVLHFGNQVFPIGPMICPRCDRAMVKLGPQVQGATAPTEQRTQAGIIVPTMIPPKIGRR